MLWSKKINLAGCYDYIQGDRQESYEETPLKPIYYSMHKDSKCALEITVVTDRLR